MEEASISSTPDNISVTNEEFSSNVVPEPPMKRSFSLTEEIIDAAGDEKLTARGTVTQ